MRATHVRSALGRWQQLTLVQLQRSQWLSAGSQTQHNPLSLDNTPERLRDKCRSYLWSPRNLPCLGHNVLLGMARDAADTSYEKARIRDTVAASQTRLPRGDGAIYGGQHLDNNFTSVTIRSSP